MSVLNSIFSQPTNTVANTKKSGPRKGWWKPLISGAGGAAIGATAAFAGSGGNPVAVISGAVSGAKKGYEVHEDIRKKFNIPWLGKKKAGKLQKRKRKRRPRKK
jgi:outer membrane lipoprotein SlyB